MIILRSTLIALVVIAGCSLPRVPVKQTFDRRETFSAAGLRVHRYEARDPRSLDTTARILRMEYLPVTLYTFVDERDSVRDIVVVAWQEVLWRFSEKLSPTDKEYYAPLPSSIARSADTAVVTWAYPSLDSRDDDLRYITPYRNSYWSVDLYRDGRVREELFRGDLRSVPQFVRYDPFGRFAPGGTYTRALGDTLPPYQALRNYLRLTMAHNAADSTRR